VVRETPTVRAMSAILYDSSFHVWGQFMPEWAERVGAGDDPVASGRATAGKHDPAMNEIRGNLYEAMRADVAPDV